MKLQSNTLESSFWVEHGYAVPLYNRSEIENNTRKAPQWLHLGAGNIFRAFLAKTHQEVLNAGKAKTGIIVAEGFDYEIIQCAYKKYDDLSIAVDLKPNGTIKKAVVGSVVESLTMDTASEDWARIQEVFTSPSLRMVSFTITEKGYNIKNAQMEYFPQVQQDLEQGPACPSTYLGKVTALCYQRFLAGKLPLALVSMDNCSHNGSRLQTAVCDYAEHWAKAGLVDPGFLAYISDGKLVSFPWTAIDKITPRPDETVRKMLEEDGLEDMSPVVTAKKTYVSGFVNAEDTQYLVIEDQFPNGRPDFFGQGVHYTTRETVDKFERMKVCTCLNPLHTCLAVYGCLLGYDLISEEMKDPQLRTLVTRIAYDESLPVVIDPGIIKPAEFLDTVLNLRFTNPYNPDSPQRIAMDTSQKLSIRFGETIKAYLSSKDFHIADLKYIPMVPAGWCRYLMGIDDNGEEMELSYDPMMETLRPILAQVKLGEVQDHHTILEPILSNPKIFGVDLYEAGLGELVEHYFAMMARGKGAVRRTLQECVH